jgi:type I restriction enzyme R subunit
MTETGMSAGQPSGRPCPSRKQIENGPELRQSPRRAALRKTTPGEGKPEEELDAAVRQLVSKAVAPAGIVDIFQAAGLKTPDISILSDEFLAEVQGLKHQNLAMLLLRKLLGDELRTRKKKYLVQSRSFAELLEQTLKRYQNRSIETATVIAELVKIAREMREGQRRGEDLGLTEDEVAFYDALEVNDSAVKILGDPVLRDIARDLVKTVRANATIDWTVREGIRAKLRVMVKRVLRHHGYPPDKEQKAIVTVLEQAELLCGDWAN